MVIDLEKLSIEINLSEYLF